MAQTKIYKISLIKYDVGADDVLSLQGEAESYKAVEMGVIKRGGEIRRANAIAPTKRKVHDSVWILFLFCVLGLETWFTVNSALPFLRSSGDHVRRLDDPQAGQSVWQRTRAIFGGTNTDTEAGAEVIDDGGDGTEHENKPAAKPEDFVTEREMAFFALLCMIAIFSFASAWWGSGLYIGFLFWLFRAYVKKSQGKPYKRHTFAGAVIVSGLVLFSSTWILGHGSFLTTLLIAGLCGLSALQLIAQSFPFILSWNEAIQKSGYLSCANVHCPSGVKEKVAEFCQQDSIKACVMSFMASAVVFIKAIPSLVMTVVAFVSGRVDLGQNMKWKEISRNLHADDYEKYFGVGYILKTLLVCIWNASLAYYTCFLLQSVAQVNVYYAFSKRSAVDIPRCCSGSFVKAAALSPFRPVSQVVNFLLRQCAKGSNSFALAVFKTWSCINYGLGPSSRFSPDWAIYQTVLRDVSYSDAAAISHHILVSSGVDVVLVPNVPVWPIILLGTLFGSALGGCVGGIIGSLTPHGHLAIAGTITAYVSGAFGGFSSMGIVSAITKSAVFAWAETPNMMRRRRPGVYKQFAALANNNLKRMSKAHEKNNPEIEDDAAKLEMVPMSLSMVTAMDDEEDFCMVPESAGGDEI